MVTLWYALQWIIDICCLKINRCARIVLFDNDEGGGPIPARLAWYEFTFRMDEGQNHMQIAGRKGVPITPGGWGWWNLILF